MDTTNEINLRILIIDDNPDVHKDFIKILTITQSPNITNLEEAIFGEVSEKKKTTLPSFQISTASQGQEGVQSIEVAIKEGKPYALAFVDIRMPPGWDGIETIKHIWALDQDIQIVICTAYSDYSWEETIKELGERDNLLILKKPFDATAVRQLAYSLTKKWQLLQNLHRYTQALETGIKERTGSLEKSMSIMRATFESSTDGILVVDKSGKLIDHNDKFIEMYGINQSQFDTKNFHNIVEYFSNQIVDPSDFQKKVKGVLDNDIQVVTGKLIFENGCIFEYFAVPHKIDGSTSGHVWSFRDITQQAVLEDKLQYQALHDDLTGLVNRAGLLNHMRREITAAANNQNIFGVFFIDLDRFKLINDSISHEAGDELLRLIAKQLQDTLRNQDIVARLGGDEFVALILNIKTKEHLSELAGKIIATLNKPKTIRTIQVTVTGSIGIAFFPTDGETAYDLLHNADVAMYHAKNMGRNQFFYYEEELNKSNTKKFETIVELRAAIEKNEFFLEYQPELDTSTDKLIAVEALIRWRHPIKGIILPMDFIPLAEETGLMVYIGDWVIYEACRQNKAWQDRGFPPIRVAVNISSCQFTQINFVSNIIETLKKVNLKPEYLEIELTENLIINNIGELNSIKELRDIGVKITLDDFGTGYSSLNYLKNISLDRLKIDKSFIDGICDQRNDQLIVQAIIAMAKSMSLEVVAEGVERKKQLDSLNTLECQKIQGYYFSKPQSPNNLEKILSKKGTIDPFS